MGGCKCQRLRLSCSSDSDLDAAVVGVIDHHLQERPPTPSCPVTIETVGSCATLVTECILQKAPQILDRQLAQLLYGKDRNQNTLRLFRFRLGSQIKVLRLVCNRSR